MKVKTDYDGTDYVIPGKLYGVIEQKHSHHYSTALVYLEDAERDDPDCILLNGPCPHLNGQACWEIVEEG